MAVFQGMAIDPNTVFQTERGPASVAALMSQADLAEAQGKQLVPAQAELARAHTGLAQQQTELEKIKVATENINLNSRVGLMESTRAALAQMAGQTPGQVAPVAGATQSPAAMPSGGPNPNTSVSQFQQPVAGGAALPPVQPVVGGEKHNDPTSMYNGIPINQQIGRQVAAGGQNVNQADERAVQTHAAETRFNSAGLPSMMSDEFLNLQLKTALANPNVDPAQAQAAYQAGKQAQIKISKDYAESVKAGMEARDAGNIAHYNAAERALASGLGTIDGQQQAMMLGIDPSAPGAVQKLQELATRSPQNQAMRKQANEDANIANEIKNRDANTEISAGQLRVARINAATAQGQLGVAQGNLQIHQITQGAEMKKGAVNSANMIDSTTQLRDTLMAVKDLVKNSAITLVEGSYYAAVDKMPGDLVQTLKRAGVAQIEDGKLIQIDSMLAQAKAGVAEAKQQALNLGGAAAQAGSDTRMKILEESLTGKGLTTAANKATILESLDAADKFTKVAIGAAESVNSNYNNYLEKDPNKIFTPSRPLYKSTEEKYEINGKPLNIGDIVNGKAYLGGNPKLATNWKK